MMRGDEEPAGPSMQVGPKGDGAAKKLLADLQQVQGLKVRYQTFPGLSHGPMLPASLRYTLEHLSQP
ncbi:Uncharacterised protein [Mycobacterium tuberculosis]|nr:Uncharacterised protein [Mycobacterium tuberculosis]